MPQGNFGGFRVNIIFSNVQRHEDDILGCIHGRQGDNRPIIFSIGCTATGEKRLEVHTWKAATAERGCNALRAHNVFGVSRTLRGYNACLKSNLNDSKT